MNSSTKNNPRRMLAVALLLVLPLAAGIIWLILGVGKTRDEATEAKLGDYRIQATIRPDAPKTGFNRIQLKIQDDAGKPITDLTVKGKARMPEMGSMPEMVSGADFEHRGSGRYESKVELTMSGTWQLRLHLENPSGKHLDAQYSLTTGVPGLNLESAGDSGSSPNNDEVAYYTCSMHPSVRSNDPGSCPICGMNLVAVSKKQIQSGVILVDDDRRQKIGITTQMAQLQPFEKHIRTAAIVTHDETRLAEVTLKYPAWIGEIYADSMGKYVKKGEPLFTVYAPELLSAQQEYLESLKSPRVAPRQQSTITKAVKERLLLWGFQASQLEDLRKRGTPRTYVPFLSPASGTIIEKEIVAGSSVSIGSRLYKLSDLRRVWIEAEVYEDELDLLETGQHVTFELSYFPAKSLSGEISFIYPTLNEQTRTGRVRILVDNPDGKLRPGMHAQMTLKIPMGEKLLIPEEAILYAGDRSIVFISLGDGKLKPQRIRTGAQSEDLVVVTEGLKAGTEIVTSGTFLIASESKLKSGIKQW